MKTILALVLLTFAFNSVFAQIDFSISGAVKSPKPENITIRMGSKVDSLQTSDDKFSYKGQLALPGEITFTMVTNTKKMVSRTIFITGGHIDIAVGDDDFIISGNQDLTDFETLIVIPIHDFNIKARALREKLFVSRVDGKPDSVMLLQKLHSTVDSCFQVPQDFIKGHPNSLLSIRALRTMGKGKSIGHPITLMNLEQLYLTIDPKIRNSPFGIEYKSDLEKWKAAAKK